MGTDQDHHETSEKIDGFVMYRKGKPVKTAEYIRESIEDATRFVCEVMGHDPRTIWQMDAFEFFRDIRRAEKKVKIQLKQLEKWQT